MASSRRASLGARPGALRIAFLILLPATAPAFGADGFALVGTTIVDGTGRPAVSDAIVLIGAERIDAVGPRSLVALPKGIPYLDGRGRFVVPGRLAEPAVAAAVRRRVGEGATFERAVADALRADATPGAEAATLERGRTADLLVLDKDPRTSLDNLGAVERAYVRGREVRR